MYRFIFLKKRQQKKNVYANLQDLFYNKIAVLKLNLEFQANSLWNSQNNKFPGIKKSLATSRCIEPSEKLEFGCKSRSRAALLAFGSLQ